MKYRTKLYLSFVLISLASSLMALIIVSLETKNRDLLQIKSKTQSMASTIAALINPKDVEQVYSQKNPNSTAYLALKKILSKIVQANRRDDLFVKFIYTLKPSSQDPNLLIFGVDSADNPMSIGAPYNYPNSQEILENLEYSYTNPDLISDRWGEKWLSAYSPIFDANGRYVATIGVDLNAQEVFTEFHEIIMAGIMGLSLSLLASLVLATFLSRLATRSLLELNQTVHKIGEGDLKTEVHLKTNDEFNELAEAINQMSIGLRERESLKMNFIRYVSEHVLEKILKSEKPTKLEGERKKITVLFSDIWQFSELIEKLTPEEIVSVLNEYFEKMLNVIFKNMGTLDKFIEDGIMVEFGAPLDDLLQEKHAIDTAIEMQKELQLLSKKWEKEGKVRVDMGIGIHTGYAVVGNIGSEKRLEYTAIGDTVNIAARLERATRTLNLPILISESTQQAIKDHYKINDLGPMTLPGKASPINVFSIDPNSH